MEYAQGNTDLGSYNNANNALVEARDGLASALQQQNDANKVYVSATAAATWPVINLVCTGQ